MSPRQRRAISASRAVELSPPRSAGINDVSASANKQLRRAPSAVSRVRSQSPQNGRVTDAITPTRAVCPVVSV
ncbi:Uncharacterised protein [Mycobacteroides abscessus subsp. abscessus]|nr:Uncharacterised protein [Mycobacteroides abscessus subsp. abscessus]